MAGNLHTRGDGCPPNVTKARKQITQVNTYLKQGKPLPAVNALYEAVLAMLKAKLMKAERDEFTKLIVQAVYQLNNNKELRQLNPLVINYTAVRRKDPARRHSGTPATRSRPTPWDQAKDQIEGRLKRRAEGLATGKALLRKRSARRGAQIAQLSGPGIPQTMLRFAPK